ncbi:GGDEF domain-containing protein [Azospirillum picis]|uniref:diguanylate cyclase n=1 Tax=Azospirillum picis TaxID=488438 RepID=A0ABU0MGZ9_9PROT|nr:GGDEF domain-containing protein [Azospirillum picis]MBP2299036.1 diguanylate cyclase (GGDEF)-like protein [Azospirillum picis]MDQ0532722.1 diguanylate cyclase (GGDEF)-like protein [Azospirillum picis]
MNLDTAFIAQVITIISFAVGLSVIVASGRYPIHIRRSLHAYAHGKFLLGSAFLVAGLRDGLWSELLIPLVNGLAISGLTLNYTSVRHLQSRRVWNALPFAAGVVVGLCCLAIVIAGGGLAGVRTLTSGAAALVLAAIAIEVLVRYEARGIPHHVTGILSVGLAFGYLVRMGSALMGDASPLHRIADDQVERVIFVMTFLGTVIGAINYVLMASDEFNRELSRLAHTDGLTGVLNRRRFFEKGEVEFRRARRHGRALTVLILDIDRFKLINDRAGHPFGDRVIRAVADCCAGQIRKEDAIGRVGGEEFALILPETDAETGQHVAERLRAAIERQVAGLAAERGLTVTCSIGGVAMSAEHGEFSDLIAQSDSALYDAKHAGRNQVRFVLPAQRRPFTVPA